MLRAFPFEEGDALMSVPLMLTFVSTVVFAIQLLIFVYLYSSHRVRFFQYLLLAWGAYTLSKGLRLVDALFLDIHHPSFVTDVATIAAVGFTLAAAFAHRWDYRLHGRDLLVGAGAVTLLALASNLGGNDEGQRIVGLSLGVVQMAAGVLFWPARSTRFRGERLLSGLLTVWGVHRIATQFVNMEPGSTSYMAVHAVFITLYFLATFAVIIMVLERARSESDRLHARLREVERLATAGELAAGMAHEIRNPLAAIVNATALLDDETGLTADERATTLAAIRTEARRLNRILSDFLHFARPQEARRVPGDIRQVVEHVSGLIRDGRSRASRVDVEVAVDPAVPRFAFDRDQLTQVLWNVALNGVEAMNGRGRLSLEVARQNEDVVLAVSDTGPGIPRGAAGARVRAVLLGQAERQRPGPHDRRAHHGGARRPHRDRLRGRPRHARVAPVSPRGRLSMAHILVVDDEPAARGTFALLLRKRGHRVLEAEGVTAATKRLAEEVFDLVVTDLRMPDGDGLDVLRAVKAHAPATEVILLTAYAEWKSAKEAIRQGALDYFEKGQEPDELNHRIDKALAARQLRRENENLRAQLRERYGLPGLIAQSPAMHTVLDLVARVAPTDATVLIQGESGHRQGGHRQGHPPRQRAGRAPVRGRQLRGDPRDPARVRALRLRARRLHRRRGQQARVCSRRPTAARCSSTRSPRCRPRSR